MNPLSSFFSAPNRRVTGIALIILALDQLTKALVLRFLGYEEERVVVESFFKLVHWGNTGAAWSLFKGNNLILAAVAVVALVVLYFTRHHFSCGTRLGHFAFGLIVGGIIGNLIDRLARGHVIDFLYFYIVRNGEVHGFPAFNVADSAICTGVALVFLLTWKSERHAKAVASSPSPSEPH
jgi:lipoprotein signal peptidase